MRYGATDSAREQLYRSLHTQPLSLLVDSICGVACAWTCALVSDIALLHLLALGLTVTACIRLAIAAYAAFRGEENTPPLLAHFRPMGAFAFAGFIGMIACATLLRDAPGEVQVLALCYAFVFTAGVSVRRAGRPLLAIGKLVVTLLPVFVACITIGSPALLMLAATIPCMAVGIGNLTIGVFRTLAAQLNAADESHRVANLMREMARTDPVTGLANRTGFMEDAPALFTGIIPGEKVALFWIDLHRFKEINEALGHSIGDEMLSETARRLCAEAPDGAIIARFAGDEFLVAVRLPSLVGVEALAGALSAALAQPVRIGGNRLESGSSIGVALAPDHGKTFDDLMKCADLALNHSKSTGRQQVCLFEVPMTRALVRRKELEGELRAAIQKDELSIFFQPIIDLSTGRIRAFEALLRWYHPEKGELCPEEFIPVAEETGLIITLGNWITAQAAKAAATWPDDITLAVNLSPVQIRAPGAALGLLASLREARLDPCRLELEVTEGLFMDDDHNTAQFMEQMTSEGVRFALDDFGTGYSSLQYISKYPFKKIKVDRSFVSGPRAGRQCDAIIRAVAEMGAALNMEIVAEGIETIEQVQFVRNAGCTLGQGYYFSRAVPDYLAAMLLSQEYKRDERERLAG